jgi:hypothetical protein
MTASRSLLPTSVVLEGVAQAAHAVLSAQWLKRHYLGTSRCRHRERAATTPPCTVQDFGTRLSLRLYLETTGPLSYIDFTTPPAA